MSVIVGSPRVLLTHQHWVGGTYLPALVCCAVVRVVLCDVIVDSVQRELLVRCQRDGLDDQLCIGVWRLGVVLGSRVRTSS